MMTPSYTDDQLDKILRSDGRSGAIGVSAIDGLMAAIVAGPCFVEPYEWMGVVLRRTPSIDERSPDLPIVNTLANYYNAISTGLSQQPSTYAPKFMHHDGQVVVHHWVVGFMLGVAMRSDAWSIILLTGHRRRLAPILVHYESRDFLPEMSADEKQRLRAVAHREIANAVVAVREICMPHRVAHSRAEDAAVPRRHRRA